MVLPKVISKKLEYSQGWLKSLFSSYRRIRWEIDASGNEKHRKSIPTKNYARACYTRLNNASHVAIGRALCHVGTKSLKPFIAFFSEPQWRVTISGRGAMQGRHNRFWIHQDLEVKRYHYKNSVSRLPPQQQGSYAWDKSHPQQQNLRLCSEYLEATLGRTLTKRRHLESFRKSWHHAMHS